MNGKNYYEITNELLEKYKICRQTKYIALKKLQKEGLIDILDRSESKGGNLKVRLLIIENEDEEK
jgi:DNA-binding PadR family transcriptional regulator